jgi:hypothetical protein
MGGYSSDEEGVRAETPLEQKSGSSDPNADVAADSATRVAQSGLSALGDMPGDQLPQQAFWWTKPILDFFAGILGTLGEARPLRLASACTGLWSEGAAFQAGCVVHVR